MCCQHVNVISFSLEYESRLFERTVRKNVIGKPFYMIANMEVVGILYENLRGGYAIYVFVDVFQNTEGS